MFLLALSSFLTGVAAASCENACTNAILVDGKPDCYCNSLCVGGKPGACCDDFEEMCPNEFLEGTNLVEQGLVPSGEVPLPTLPPGCVLPEGFVIPIPANTYNWVERGETCQDNCNSGMTKDGKKQPFCFCDSGCLLTSDCCVDFLEHCAVDPCVMALVAPQSVAPTVPAVLPNGVKPGSCDGQCGKLVPDQWMQSLCSCEQACVEKRNCCDDFEEMCEVDPSLEVLVPEVAPDSCFGKCGGDAGECYCDFQCLETGDCCTDYLDMCGSKFSMHPWRGHGSCHKKCGGAGNDCWCDDACMIAGDCCSDYLNKCVIDESK